MPWNISNTICESPKQKQGSWTFSLVTEDSGFDLPTKLIDWISWETDPLWNMVNCFHLKKKQDDLVHHEGNLQRRSEYKSDQYYDLSLPWMVVNSKTMDWRNSTFKRQSTFVIVSSKMINFNLVNTDVANSNMINILKKLTVQFVCDKGCFIQSYVTFQPWSLSIAHLLCYKRSCHFQ